MRLWVRSLALLSELRMQRGRELWRRLQMQLGSGIAVALAKTGGYSSDYTASLGTSMCHGSGSRKGKKTEVILAHPSGPPGQSEQRSWARGAGVIFHSSPEPKYFMQVLKQSSCSIKQLLHEDRREEEIKIEKKKRRVGRKRECFLLCLHSSASRERSVQAGAVWVHGYQISEPL